MRVLRCQIGSRLPQSPLPAKIYAVGPEVCSLSSVPVPGPGLACSPSSHSFYSRRFWQQQRASSRQSRSTAATPSRSTDALPSPAMASQIPGDSLFTLPVFTRACFPPAALLASLTPPSKLQRGFAAYARNTGNSHPNSHSPGKYGRRALATVGVPLTDDDEILWHGTVSSVPALGARYNALTKSPFAALVAPRSSTSRLARTTLPVTYGSQVQGRFRHRCAARTSGPLLSSLNFVVNRQLRLLPPFQRLQNELRRPRPVRLYRLLRLADVLTVLKL